MFYLIFLILTISVAAQNNSVKTVNYVDLEKYSGRWYEIAKIPNKFQKHCYKGTTAEYLIKKNGEIEVTNSCFEKDGNLDKTVGVARIVDTKTNAKLEVSFVSFLGWRPFWGDYWILGLDENYKWAFVGTPNRKYGWILSRTSSLDKSILDKIFEILKSNGYNVKDFEFGIQ